MLSPSSLEIPSSTGSALKHIAFSCCKIKFHGLCIVMDSPPFCWISGKLCQVYREFLQSCTISCKQEFGLWSDSKQHPHFKKAKINLSCFSFLWWLGSVMGGVFCALRKWNDSFSASAFLLLQICQVFIIIWILYFSCGSMYLSISMQGCDNKL